MEGRNCLLKHIIEGKRYKGGEDEEEDFSRYYMNLRKGEKRIILGTLRILEVERGNTNSKFVEKWFSKGVW
jgi:RecB family endonuclease NucS